MPWDALRMMSTGAHATASKVNHVCAGGESTGEGWVERPFRQLHGGGAAAVDDHGGAAAYPKVVFDDHLGVVDDARDHLVADRLCRLVR